MIPSFKKCLQAIACLDLILGQEYAYFSYQSKWSAQAEMASCKNGSGEESFLWIGSNAMAWKYFEHELGCLDMPMDDFPTGFEDFLNEPAFEIEHSTAIYFYKNDHWTKFGKENFLIDRAFQRLSWQAEDYHEWAEDYYEKEIPIEFLQAVFANQLDKEIIKCLNTNLDLNDILEELEEIGFSLL